MSNSWRVPLFLVTAVLVSSCFGSPEDALSPETPNDESGPPAAQIEEDLYGKTFLYFHRGSDPKSRNGYMTGTWTAERGELRAFAITRRFRNVRTDLGTERTDEVQVMVTLADEDQIIRGPLAFQYMKTDKGWRLFYMGPRDGDWWHDFSFERTRRRDGKRTVEMTPAHVPAGPSPYTPKVRGQPVRGGSAVIQAY
ncbi:MAG: hypothetical protein ACREL3_02590 [Gemmatimonadales bacterium]